MLLALDISTTGTGYAILNKKDNSVVVSGVLKLTKEKDWRKRVHYMAVKLQEICLPYMEKLTDLVIEESYAKLSIKTVKQLSFAQGVIIAPFFYENTIEKHYIYPKQWQAYFDLAKFKRNDLKKESIKLAQDIFEKTVQDDNEADSLLLAGYLGDMLRKQQSIWKDENN